VAAHRDRRYGDGARDRERVARVVCGNCFAHSVAPVPTPAWRCGVCGALCGFPDPAVVEDWPDNVHTRAVHRGGDGPG
jgi:hypothetical protein